jgi:putative glutamine amidotransferase
MTRPVIGICTPLERARWGVWDLLAFVLPRNYVDAVHRAGAMALLLAPGSLAARAAGEEHHATKSHHHQGVDRVGEGLEVTGWATVDELPEALELPGNGFALGVQWHPEADETSRLIAALVEHTAQRTR